jgi:hypothetical protein
MDSIENRVKALEQSNRRQRLVIAGLSAVVFGGALVAGATPAGDIEVNKVTCKSLIVKDANGKPRFAAGANNSLQHLKGDTFGTVWYDLEDKPRLAAGTDPYGNASLQLIDSQSRRRLVAASMTDGAACLEWLDKDGKRRLSAVTDNDGWAGISFFDRDELSRCLSGTTASGAVGTTWLDRQERIRIFAGVGSEGSLILPIADRQANSK